MNCANCKYNDGMLYTSIPPKYRCTITNEFHLEDDDCNVEFETVKHGKWEVVHDSNGVHHVCPHCGEWRYHSKQLYCGNCGAKLDEVM